MDSTLGRRKGKTRVGAMSLMVLSIGAALALGGCMFAQLVGGMAASAERSGSHDVKARYSGLADKTFAVAIAADRTLQSEYPQIVSAFTQEITRRIALDAGASGVLPADEVLSFQFKHPGWTSLSPLDLAKELEVDRLVFIDLSDFTLNEPGNQYEWHGVAAGTIAVVETDAQPGLESTFREPVRVTFPDNSGHSRDNLAAQTVLSELSRRFCERAAWLFYDHQEPNVIKY
jgi:hypothetical protein